jgi:nicotinate-nucleotide adenylyltransferase
MNIILPKIITVANLQDKIRRTYKEIFGRTPLQQRLDDIFGEATELRRYTDLENMREETGDLLSSLLQLCNENGWKATDLIDENIKKIRRRKHQYQGLGRKTRIAILGGSFNPPHIGHIAVANFVLNSLNIFDECWLMPCNSHIYNKKMVSAQDRLAMCRLAVQGHPRILVSDFEIRHHLSGETYHMIKKFLEVYKDEIDPSIVIGLDNANTFDKWVNYRDLERMIQFVVVPRPGEKRDPKINWYMKPPHVWVEDDRNIIPELSSTLVRKNIVGLYGNKGHEAARYFLNGQIHPDVLQYIINNNLYKNI